MDELIERLETLVDNGEAQGGTLLVRVTTLRQAAAGLRRVREAPVVELEVVHERGELELAAFISDDIPGPAVYYSGQRLRLVPERGEVR